MTKDISAGETFALQAAFGRAMAPIPDHGFSEAVLGRVRRRIWFRRLALLPGMAIGILVALPALSQLLLMLSNEALALIASAEQSEAAGQFRLLITMLPLREAVQTLSSEVTRLGSYFAEADWYHQNVAFFIAGLSAAISLAVTRAIGR